MMIINGIKKFSMYCTYLCNYGSMLLLQQMYTLYNLYHKYLEGCRYIRQKCIIYFKSVQCTYTYIIDIYNKRILLKDALMYIVHTSIILIYH